MFVHPQVSALFTVYCLLFTVLFCLVLVKEKLNILLLVQIYIKFYFGKITKNKGQKTQIYFYYVPWLEVE